MIKIQRAVAVSLVICYISILTIGCGRRENTKKGDGRTKVEHFRDTQGLTMTPHGKMKMDTVAEGADGKIHYETEDGKRWRVDMTKQADETYHYGTPDEVR
jgi:hypothetical protein